MLHLNSSCIPDFENIKDLLKSKDYHGVKENRDIKKFFEDISLAFKDFGNSLKTIHNNGNTIISNIHKNSNDDNKFENVYFSKCFLNVISLIQIFSEENLALSEQIQKNIVNKLEEEENERVKCINSIYKEDEKKKDIKKSTDTISINNNDDHVENKKNKSKDEDNKIESTNNNSENIAKPTNLGHDQTNEIFIDNIPLNNFEIKLKKCLENNEFSNRYLNHIKYKRHFLELNRLNINLDKEITAFKELTQKFGKNVNKLLMTKSKERILAIQNKKKSIFEFLYDDIKELKEQKLRLMGIEKDIPQSGDKDDTQDEEPPKDNAHATSNENAIEKEENEKEKNEGTTKKENLYLEKFEIREKYRIEILYSSIRTFIKLISLKHIDMNILLLEKSDHISSYDSFVDYQNWLSCILNKGIDVDNLQKKIKKYDILTKDEQYMLYPYKKPSSSNNSKTVKKNSQKEKKKSTASSNFRKGELMDSENISLNKEKESLEEKEKIEQKTIQIDQQNYKQKKDKKKRANSRRDCQFPDKFYIPIIIKKKYTKLETIDYINEHDHIKNEKNMHKQGENEEKKYKHMDVHIKTYLNDNEIDSEKNIITFFKNRQKNYEKYLLQFSNVGEGYFTRKWHWGINNQINSGSESESESENENDHYINTSENALEDITHFRGYFHEEAHYMYPFKFPKGITSISHFNNTLNNLYTNSLDFGEDDINENDYKLLAYESILLVYYSLCSQLNMCLFFDDNKKSNVTSQLYKRFQKKYSHLLPTLEWKEKENIMGNPPKIMNKINASKYYTKMRKIDNNSNEPKKVKDNNNTSTGFSSFCNNEKKTDDFFQYMSYIENVKMENILLIKRILTIFRIKLNLDSRTNNLITLFTLPNYYLNNGHTYSFHILDIRFRIVRIIDTLDLKYTSDINIKETRTHNFRRTNSSSNDTNTDYTIYGEWIKRQLHIFYISLYLKFNRFIKFIPYFNFSYYPYNVNNIFSKFKQNEEYFSYLNTSTESSNFVKYIKHVQKKIQKIHNYILSKKRKNNSEQIGRDKQDDLQTNFIDFKNLEKDEKIIFISNLLLKNFIKSFRIVFELKSILKQNEWNTGKHNEKMRLSNMIKYFTKIEYYDYEIRNIFSQCIDIDKEEETINKVDKYDQEINESHINSNMASHSNNSNMASHSNNSNMASHSNNSNMASHSNNSNLFNYDKLIKTIFEKELKESDNVRNAKFMGSSIQSFSSITTSKHLKTKSLNTENIHFSKSNNILKSKLSKQLKNKIFYKLNLETVLLSSWFMDRNLLHFFLYFYMSCVIDKNSDMNTYSDAPYIIQGIFFIMYYLQTGNDITLKPKNQAYENGNESTLIPMSTFILYFFIHLFYSFLDKNMLVILSNEELNGNIELFLNPQNIQKKNEQISKTNNANIGDPKKKTQNIITLQIATKFYYSLKNFHKLLFYRTIDDSILEKCDEAIDLNNLESYISNYGHANNKDNMKKGFSSKLSYEDMTRISQNAKKGNRFSAGGIPGEMYKSFEIKKKKKRIFRKSSKKDNLVTQVLNLNNTCEKLLIENYVKKQKQINDMIYLKRYRNILLYYNYYNFENLASPYIPNTLSFYMNTQLYSFDHFFSNSVLLNYENNDGNNENNHNYLLDYNSYKKKTKKNPLIDNYNSLENIQSYKESVCVDNNMNSHKKSENFNPDYLNNDCNFSLINITRIEKIISDITIMKMISCDFRNYLILILSNYRKFIDMYSLSYILDMFLVIHTFFEINKNKTNLDESKEDSLKILQKSITSTNSKVIEKHTSSIPNHNNNIKSQNNETTNFLNYESCQFNPEFLTQCEIENYFKFFIYNSVKNIFYNIFSTTKNEIEMKEAKKAAEENKKKPQAEILSSKNKQDDINPFDNCIDSSTNAKKSKENNNEQSVDKSKLDVTSQNMENEEEEGEKIPLIYELVYNQFGDMVNKYINEIVMEILFFSKIWKEYLSLDEHPLTVLYGANKTLYHEILKFLKYNNKNTDFLFNQTLSIIVSLYNFNLINKEIIIQTNCYQKYRALIRNNYQYYSNPKEDGNENNGTDAVNNETQQSDQNKTINQFKSITKQPTSRMENKIMNYYENQSSLVNNSIQIDNENKNNKVETKEENVENKEDIFISLSLIISNSNNPCMVKLMFKLEKIFIQIIDKRLKHTKKLLYECSKNEKLVPINSPDIIYNSTCVDIFSIILNILEILFQYKCPIEWIMIPFLDFLNNFIIEYCENYKKRYSSFIISLLNQYADNYFNGLLNITERQKIKWDKYISIGKKKKIQKNMNSNNISSTNKDLNKFPDIFKKNDLDILNNKKESVLFDENLEQEFSDINEVTKRIKHKKKKKNIFYNLFNYEGLGVNKIKHKVGEILDDINEFSNLSTLYHGTNTSNKKLDSGKKTAEKSDENINEENEDSIKKLFSEDLINIIEEINYFFDDSDMSESLVLIWNISFFMNQITEIRKKIERYILKYICTRTESVEKISKIFNNYIDFNINTETLQKNYYTKTLLGVLDTSIDNIKNNLNNFLYHVFKVLSIRIICYEFQQELFYNLYRPFHINNLASIVSIFPDTIEKFFIQLPNKFFKNMLTIFIELLIKIWILIIIEKGFSATFEFKDRHIHIMKNDNLLLKKYIQNNQIKLSHTFLTKKYDINEYIDAFFDALYANRNMFSDISADKSKNKK